MADRLGHKTAGDLVRTADDDLRRWPLSQLVDHIISTHHRYVRAELPAATTAVEDLVRTHGERHPALKSMLALLDALSRDLTQHMAKEELVLFPYLRTLDTASAGEVRCPFGTVSNPIRMMEREHIDVGRILQSIRALTGNYIPPQDDDAAYGAVWRRLEAFERDLHQHVHLENDILFPRAQECERALWRS